MPTTTLSSREFNQDTSRAEKAANEGPVFIIDRGVPAHVLLNYEEYERLINTKGTLIERLGLPPGVEDIEIEFPRMGELPRSADLT